MQLLTGNPVEESKKAQQGLQLVNRNMSTESTSPIPGRHVQGDRVKETFRGRLQTLDLTPQRNKILKNSAIGKKSDKKDRKSSQDVATVSQLDQKEDQCLQSYLKQRKKELEEEKEKQNIETKLAMLRKAKINEANVMDKDKPRKSQQT